MLYHFHDSILCVEKKKKQQFVRFCYRTKCHASFVPMNHSHTHIGRVRTSYIHIEFYFLYSNIFHFHSTSILYILFNAIHMRVEQITRWKHLLDKTKNLLKFHAFSNSQLTNQNWCDGHTFCFSLSFSLSLFPTSQSRRKDSANQRTNEQKKVIHDSSSYLTLFFSRAWFFVPRFSPINSCHAYRLLTRIFSFVAFDYRLLHSYGVLVCKCLHKHLPFPRRFQKWKEKNKIDSDILKRLLPGYLLLFLSLSPFLFVRLPQAARFSFNGVCYRVYSL